MENSGNCKSQPPHPPSDSGLASSGVVREYPPRLHTKGKSPLINHSMNHYSSMANLSIVKQELGDDVWSYLKNSSIGVFAKFAVLKYTFAAQRVEYFLANQLLVDDVHEIWSLVDDQPLRFSLNEFAAFTGLNCAPIQPFGVCALSHEEFWREMEISTATGPTYDELLTVMAKSHLWDFDKRLMVAQLCVLSVAVLGIHKGSRIPLEIAKRVLDKQAFEKYPWGRVAFERLIGSIKMIKCKEKCYTLQGPVHVLLTWVYEHVVGLGETYGIRRLKENEEDPDEVPHLNWLSGRKKIKFDEFISKEKADHGKVRVKHLVEVPIWDMFPMGKIDPLVRNLIEDIISGNLRANAWSEDAKNKKRKVFVEDKKIDEVDDVETSNKKKKMKGKEHVEDAQDNSVDMVGMFKMMERVSSTVEDMKYLIGDLAKRVEANERNRDEEKEFRTMFSILKKNLEDVEKAQANEAVESTKKSVDDVTSAAPSWMVEVNQTSNNEFPSTRVVKKGKDNKAEKEENRVEKPQKKGEKVKHQAVLVEKDVTKKVVVKVEKTDGEKKKKTEASNSQDSVWSNPKHKEASKAMDKTLDSLLNLTSKVDVSTPKGRRELKLAGSQKYPFVGSSTVKRIIAGVIVSPAAYDPFEVVDEFLHEKLMEYLKTDEEEPLQTKDVQRKFYLSLITPRTEWPDTTYGWLSSMHISVVMSMFRNRLTRDPSPFCSERIAFLDSLFVTRINRDYKDYMADRKKFVFNKNYIENVNGLDPVVTNKRWFCDIDHLYACLHVGGNHWVALDIDFKKYKIFLYDSIPPEDDTELLADCRPIRKMIPVILSEYIPATERKKSCKMMDVVRVLNNVPINQNPGDCGVYALKYIECLALGYKFDGLSDKIIQAVRVKLGSEVFQEVHNEVEGCFDEDSRHVDFITPHLIDEDKIDVVEE